MWWNTEGLRIGIEPSLISYQQIHNTPLIQAAAGSGIFISHNKYQVLTLGNDHVGPHQTSPVIYKPVASNAPVTAFRDLDRRCGFIEDWLGHKWTTDCDVDNGYIRGQSYDQHEGTDYGGMDLDPVFAALPGEATVVVKCGTTYPEGPKTYGTYVTINHGALTDGNNYETQYGHLNCNSLEISNESDNADLPWRIAGMGDTGYSDGVHLHFNVRQSNTLVDPYDLSFDRYRRINDGAKEDSLRRSADRI